MKKVMFCFAAIFLIVFLASCSQGVSQEQYNAIVSELNALKSQLSESSPTKDEIFDEPISEPQQEVNVESSQEVTQDIGTRKNPAKIGDTITVKTYDSLIEITLTEVIRGDEALKIAKQANKYNEVAEGKEIIMAKFKIKNVQDLSGNDEVFLASDIQFSYSDSSFAVSHSFASVAGLEKELFAELYEGAETEGYVCFEANSGEPSPYAVFNDGTWFLLQ